MKCTASNKDEKKRVKVKKEKFQNKRMARVRGKKSPTNDKKYPAKR